MLTQANHNCDRPVAIESVDSPNTQLCLADPSEYIELGFPEAFVDDVEIIGGVKYLREHAQSIDFRLLTAAHVDGNSVSQAGIDFRAEAERIGCLDGVLFLEGVSTTSGHTKITAAFNSASMTVASPEIMETIMRRASEVELESNESFIAGVIAGLYGTKAEVSIPDWNTDGSSVVDQAILEAHMTIYDSDGNSSLEDTMGAARRYIEYRDWCMVGRIGRYLQTRASSKNPMEQKQYAALLVGSLHGGIADILGGLGLQVEVAGERTTLHDSLRDVGSVALN